MIETLEDRVVPATAPIAFDAGYAVLHDTPVSGINLSQLAADPDGDPVQVSIVSGPSDGALTQAADGTYTYTPNAHWIGQDSFTFDAIGDGLTSNVATISLDVYDNPPAALDAGYNVLHDSPLSGISLSPFVYDIDGDAMTISIVSGPSDGTLTHAADGTYTYTPNAHWIGQDSFTFAANDGVLTSDVATVSLNVYDNPPTALDAGYNVLHDSPLTGINLSPFVYDIDGDATTVSIVNGPSDGTLTQAADGTYTYTPNAHWIGQDSFTFAANDGILTGDVATVSLSVYDNPPTAYDTGYSVLHDLPLTGIDLSPSVSDADGDATTVNIVSGPSDGTLTHAADGTYTYTPNAHWIGQDSFTFAASDGVLTGNTATVSLNVYDNAPNAVGTSYSVLHDSPLTGINLSGLVSDPDGDATTVNIVSGPSDGTLTQAADGTFTYTPNAHWTGQDSFTFDASDGVLTGNTATVSLNVYDNAPTALDTGCSVLHDSSLTGINLSGLVSDPDGDATTISIVSGPSDGTLTQAADGTYTYTPNAHWIGNDSFTFEASDGVLTGNTATVSLNVYDNAPVAWGFGYSTLHDTPVTEINLAQFADDPDGDPLQFSIVSGPSNGTLIQAADGTYTYTPNPGWTGADSFTFQPSDGILAGNVATITIAVTNGEFIWNGLGSDNLASDGANWVPGVAPVYGDLVIFNGTSSKTADFDPAFAQTLTAVAIDPAFTGQIVLQQDLSIDTLITQAGGTIILGGFNFNINAAASYDMPAGNLDGPGYLNVAGTVNWTGGAWDPGTAEIDNGATLNISPSSSVNLTGWTVNDDGAVNWTQGDVNNSDTTVNVNGDGALNISSSGTWGDALGDGGSTINNAGAMNATNNAPTTIQTVFDSTGTITLEGDSGLMLTGSGVIGGQVQIDVPCFIDLAGGLTLATASPSVLVQNAGSGIVAVSWDQQPSPVNLGASFTLDVATTVTGLDATMLTSDAVYQITTNGTLASVNAEAGVTGVGLTVDTTNSLGRAWVGPGDILQITLPVGDGVYGPSTLDVYSRNDVGTITGPSGGVGALGGTFQFANLDGSITGFDHISQVLATGWLGEDAGSVVTTNHGIDTLQAEGVNADVDTTLAFDPSDANSAVTIGAGGITQTMSLGNVGSFTDSGNINTIQMASLNGPFVLNGAVTVNEFDLASAQNGDLEARRATITRMRGMPRYYDRVQPNYFMDSLNVGNFGTFILGYSRDLGANGAARLIVAGDIEIRNIGSMIIYGRLQAESIFIRGSVGVGGVQVTGISLATQTTTGPYAANDPYAVKVAGMFLVGQFTSDDMGGAGGFTAGTSVYIPRFLVRSGTVDQINVGYFPAIGPPDPASANFLGSIWVNGDVTLLTVRGSIYVPDGVAAPSGNNLIEVTGTIKSLSASTIGSYARAKIDNVQATSFGTITVLNPYAGTTQNPFFVNRLDANVIATNGEITSLNVSGGVIKGNITVQGGDLENLQARSLYGNVIVQRNRSDLTDNIGGNIWNIDVTGSIGRDPDTTNENTLQAIQADNGIGSISAGYISTTIRIILQMGGAVVTDADGKRFQLGGGSLYVQVTGGVFFPRAVLFTYGIVAPTNPGNVNLNVPNAWKADWSGQTAVMTIRDNPGQVRNVFWLLSVPQGTINLFAQGINFMQPNNGNTLDLFAAVFDGNPNGIGISQVID